MASFDRRELITLLRWRPPGGVLSIYLDLEPGDRGEAWRIELRNGLRSAVEAVGADVERQTRLELERTADRIADRVSNGSRPDGRARIGFVEVGGAEGERWYSLSLSAGETRVTHASRPVLHPLLAVLDHGVARGVVAVSSEQVRLLGWTLGEVEEIDSWGLEVLSRDWRERRSRATTDPARAQGVAASGRDQFDQRMDANRERFLREAGALASARARERRWREVNVFGEDSHFRLFADGFGKVTHLRQVGSRNLVSQPAHAIAERFEAKLPEISRDRVRALVAEVQDEAHGGTRGALGLEETFQALLEGRVEHLIVDPRRRYELPDGTPLADGADPDLPVGERMIELALSTSAAVTLLDSDGAASLGEQGGVGALLRY